MGNAIMSQRLAWFLSDDSHLLAQCDVDTYRASGPGGQKRNKTSSAVRLRHQPTGLIVIAEESRSQHENKAKALRRLRHAFMLKLREPIGASFEALAQHDSVAALRAGDGKLHVPSAKDPRYWPAVGIIFDVLDLCAAQVSEAAKHLSTTTANLLSLLELDPKVWEQANIARRKFGRPPLRISD
jgi:hypothetical protein